MISRTVLVVVAVAAAREDPLRGSKALAARGRRLVAAHGAYAPARAAAAVARHGAAIARVDAAYAADPEGARRLHAVFASARGENARMITAVHVWVERTRGDDRPGPPHRHRVSSVSHLSILTGVCRVST